MIEPMTAAHAEQIAGWVYEGAFGIYSFAQDAGAMRELMNGQYYAYLDSGRQLAGYFCYGTFAQIPAIETDAYLPAMLDIGLGLRPDLCGNGRGAAFVKAGMDFAQAQFHARQLRLTVAVWNSRAIRTYEKLGFRAAKTITHRISQQRFQMMISTDELEERL